MATQKDTSNNTANLHLKSIETKHKENNKHYDNHVTTNSIQTFTSQQNSKHSNDERDHNDKHVNSNKSMKNKHNNFNQKEKDGGKHLNFNCDSCGQLIDETALFAFGVGCPHCFCHDCIQRQVLNQIIQNELPCQCSVPNCNNIMENSKFLQFLNQFPKAFDKLMNNIIKRSKREKLKHTLIPNLNFAMSNKDINTNQRNNDNDGDETDASICTNNSITDELQKQSHGDLDHDAKCQEKNKHGNNKKVVTFGANGGGIDTAGLDSKNNESNVNDDMYEDCNLFTRSNPTRYDTILIQDTPKAHNIKDYKMESEEAFKLAVEYLKDALQARKPQKRIQARIKRFGFLTPFQSYRFAKSKTWKRLVFILIWCNMLKAVWEPPEHKMTPDVKYFTAFCVVRIKFPKTDGYE